MNDENGDKVLTGIVKRGYQAIFYENWPMWLGGLLLRGIAFGVIIQRTRFCFVRGFRDPFMTGEGEVPRAIAVSIIISVLGFAALKWTGLRGERVYVAQT